MGKRTHLPLHNIAEHATPTAKTPALMEWKELNEAQQSALLRVEGQALDTFDQWAQSNRATSPSQGTLRDVLRWKQSWSWAAATSLGMALLLLMWKPWGPSTSPIAQRKPPVAWPTLQTQGHAQLRWSNAVDSPTAQLHIDVPSAESAQFSDPHHWTLQTQGGTQLVLQRQDRKQMQVTLSRGSIVAHVRPKSMQQFLVKCKGQFDVVVKGTVFAVKQGPQWLRVEVMRGRVMVQHRAQAVAIVNAGEGVRFAWGQNTPKRYPIFTQTQHTPSDLMRWLRVHAPQELLLYAKDIATQWEWSQPKRRTVLETIANLLARERRDYEAFQLWLQLYQWQPKGFEGQTALFQAAQHCRRWQSAGVACVRLYQTWLKQFPQGMPHLHEASLFGLLQLLHKQRNHDLFGLYRRAYFKRYPQGIHLRTVRRMRIPKRK